MPKDLREYLEQLQLEHLFKELGAIKPKILAKTVEHFTVNEAERRDSIVLSYFGQNGINHMVTTITKALLVRPTLSADAEVLDIGAGTGFFTTRIADKVHSKLPNVAFYAMDLTPAMLLSLGKKRTSVTSFIGLAENIEGSIKEARKSFNIPLKFDAVFSTLMLHHSACPEKVFKSLKTVLKKDGKAVIADLCEHTFEEFKTEMGDVHLGFKPENIRKMASKHFSDVTIEKMPGIRCECSGRAADIFIAITRDSP